MASPRRCILCVDDNEEIRLMLCALLQAEGYRAVGAASGPGAVVTARAEDPDLILMDLGLPGFDGFTATRFIREEVELRDIPVVIVSAYDTLELRNEAIAAGCTGYIVKPIDPDQLKVLVKGLLRRTD